MRTTKAIADLRQQIHDDLRRQHPEWILSNGESPMCDAYEARLMDELALVLSPSHEPTEWQRVGNQVNAAFIFAGADFVDVRNPIPSQQTLR